MATICILGAGLGGIPMALEMREKARKHDTVRVVCDLDRYQFIPSNPWVAVGWREPAEIEVPLGPMFKKRGIDFTPMGAERVEPDKNRIILKDGNGCEYDFLVIATGPSLDFSAVPGLGPRPGFTQSVCKTDHAMEACKTWHQFVKQPGPIVAGAALGASCFGPAYEFTMIMETDLRRRKIRDQVPMTFVTSEPYIGHLGLNGVGDTKGLLETVFRERSIKWICNAGIDGLVNPKGFVIVNAYQQNPIFRNVFAIGVCVAIAPKQATPVPTGVPKTGFMIESMVMATARNIRSILDDREPEAEPTLNAVCLADFGDSGVGFVAMPQIPPRNVNWSSRGRHIHLAKLAFEKYFLHKVRDGISEPYYERYIFKALGIDKLKKQARTTE
ncbi:MAG: FAD-dependent oxidoreductase [Deltaproteobacteria bacterium]|nr:FAD-dependent oxidoreductase [Deltaproteobacteria bacterium]